MGITYNTHFNPCFWIANWNSDYFKSIKSGRKHGKPREQKIFSLNVKSNKIISTIIDDVHYDKSIGLADITPKDMISFCKRNFPKEVPHMEEYLKDHKEELVMDIENIWCALEQTPVYTELLKIIYKNDINIKTDIEWIACFIIIQRLRSHAVFNSLLEFNEQFNLPRFEWFWILKSLLSNEEYLRKAVSNVLRGKWTFFILASYTFPISDSAVCIKQNGMMVVLSPRILLEIKFMTIKKGIQVKKVNKISRRKLKEYYRSCVKNTFKEIIFEDKAVLENIKNTKYFKRQIKYISNNKSMNKLVLRINNYELWKSKTYLK